MTDVATYTPTNQLPAASGQSEQAGSNIQWIRGSDGAMIAYIQGDYSTNNGRINIIGIGPSASDNGVVSMHGTNATDGGYSGIDIGYSHVAGGGLGIVASVLDAVTGISNRVTILQGDSAGGPQQSSFVQATHGSGLGQTLSQAMGNAGLVYAKGNSTAAAPTNAVFAPLELAGVGNPVNVQFDPVGAFDHTTGRYNCSNTGFYLCFGAMGWAAGTALQASVGARNLRTSSRQSVTHVSPSFLGGSGTGFITILQANLNDQLQLFAIMSTGEVIEASASDGSATTYFCCMQIM